MSNPFWPQYLLGIPFVIMDVNGWHMMGDWNHMMDWWGVPFLGFWWIGVWIIQLIVAFFVFKDAYGKDNAILWFILVILPWIGFIFLIIYVILRDEKEIEEEVFSSAQKILDERYAKGEMTREEYLQARNDIEKKR